MKVLTKDKLFAHICSELSNLTVNGIPITEIDSITDIIAQTIDLARDGMMTFEQWATQKIIRDGDNNIGKILWESPIPDNDSLQQELLIKQKELVELQIELTKKQIAAASTHKFLPPQP